MDLNTIEEIDQNFFERLVTSQSNINETCLSIVTDIINGKLPVLRVIECLDEIICNSDITLRRGGIDILTTILSELPDSLLTAQQIGNFVRFYCGLLNEHHSLIPFILKGLLALVKMQQLPDNLSSTIFTSISMNFTCQSQPQADRRICYELMQVMMEKKLTELQALGPDFVCGYLSIIESERDPRNLMLIFKHLPYFFRNFPLGHLVDDAFEAVSCYFPIDFRSNPKDPRGITRDDLSNVLMTCLTANEKFHCYAIDLALEKFSSDLEVAKIDSLMLIKQCFSDFPSNKISSSSPNIVSVLVKQMIPNIINFETQELCADVAAHIVKYLNSHNESDVEGKVIDLIYSGLEMFINDIDLSFFLPTVKLLARISASCSTACQYLTARVVPKLFYFLPRSKSQVLVVMEGLNLLLMPCVALKINCASVLESTWEQVTDLLLQNCEKSIKEVSMTAFSVTTSIISLFNKEQRDICFMQLTKRIKYETDDDLWNKCADCLRRLAKVYPLEIKSFIEFELVIPDFQDECKKRVFKFFCVIAPVLEFTRYFDTVVKLLVPRTSKDLVAFVIESIKSLLVQEKLNEVFLKNLHHDFKLTNYLLDWWEAGNTVLPDSSSIFDDENVAKNMTLIITIIVRSLNEKSQKKLATNIFKLMIDYSQRFMNSFYYLEHKGDLCSPDLHCSLFIIYFEAILIGTHPKILTETLSFVLPQIIKYLDTVALYCSRPFCCLVASRCLATIMNKFLDDSCLQPQIETLYLSINSVFMKHQIPLSINATNVLFYLIKSLVYRNHADFHRCFNMLLSILPNQEIHKNIEMGFHILSMEDEYFLNAASHFRIEPGYNERLLSCAVPKLLEFSKTDNSSIRRICAVSIIYLLINSTQNNISKYMKEIIPFFLFVLVDDEPADIIIPTLNKISAMLEENAVAFEEYIETILSKLTSLACGGKIMNIRIAALKCLLQLTKLNPAVILPFKSKISQELAPCLDDKKRLVRREAVKTRSKWLVLGLV